LSLCHLSLRQREGSCPDWEENKGLERKAVN